METLNENESVFTPADFIRSIARDRKLKAESLSVPERLLMTYQRSTYDNARKLIRGRSLKWWMYGDAQPFCVGRFNDVEVGLGRFWIGAPAATMTLEEVIACGSKMIFEVGLSGGLQPTMYPGDIVVATRAIRDEGTSNHYLPSEINVESSNRLREKLTEHLTRLKTKHLVGPVWSTDGVYRETRAKCRKFKNDGVLAVNMETSAIFALAQYRNVEAASAQVISDVLSETGWLQAFEHQPVRVNTQILLKEVLETLSES